MLIYRSRSGIRAITPGTPSLCALSAAQLLEVDLGRLNPELPSHPGAHEQRRDEDGQQKTGADMDQQNGKEEGGRDGADRGKGCCKACAPAADGGWKDLSGQEIGLGIGAHVGHEVVEREAAEQEQGAPWFGGLQR